MTTTRTIQMSRSSAEAQGYTVDTTVYPWVARRDGSEDINVPTDAESHAFAHAAEARIRLGVMAGGLQMALESIQAAGPDDGEQIRLGRVLELALSAHSCDGAELATLVRNFASRPASRPAGSKLEELRRLARKCDVRTWHSHFTTHGDPHIVPDGKTAMFRLADISTSEPDYGRATAHFIGACDPATVLAIAEHVETLESEIRRLKGKRSPTGRSARLRSAVADRIERIKTRKHRTAGPEGTTS